MPIRITIETIAGHLVSTRIEGEDSEAAKAMLADSMADPHPHPIELGDLLIMSDNVGAAWVVVENPSQSETIH